MGRKLIIEESSSYYPPRARWYSVIFSLGNAIRRRLALDRLGLPGEMNIRELIAGFLVPGLAVYLRGPRLWGQAAMAASALLFFIFIIGLGFPAANIAFGLMISIHASGFVYYCNPLLAHEPLHSRLGFTFLVLLGAGFLIYVPMRNVIQNRWVLPVSANGHVIVIQKNATFHDVHRGDAVAFMTTGYSFSNHGGQGVTEGSSLNLGAVLAVAGDHVEFSPKTFSVNGVSHVNLPHMPATGNVVIPENHWFIWPNLAISGNWNVGEENLSAAMLHLANVSEDQFIGRPFRHWFGRKQIIP